jgi:hypothetical protein
MGSSPILGTSHGRIAQLVRASGLHPGGRGFEPCFAHPIHSAELASQARKNASTRFPESNELQVS